MAVLVSGDTLAASVAGVMSDVEPIIQRHEAKYAYTPHAKQLLIHQSTAKRRAAFTGNRFGKSDMLVNEALYWLRGHHPNREIPEAPIHVRFYMDGYDGPHWIDTVRPKFRQYYNPRIFGKTFDQAFKRGDRELPGLKGSTLRFMSYNLADTTRSTQVYGGSMTHLHVFDEHGQIEVYREAGARFGDGVTPEILIGYTPLLGRAAWEYDELYIPWQAGNPRVECIEGTIWDNPYAGSHEEIEEYLSTLPEDERQIRESGVFVQVGGLVYKFDRATHVVPFNAERVAGATKTLIIDPHPSRTKGHHLLWCGVDSDNRMFCYREWNPHQPINEICDQFRAICTEDASLKEDIRRYFMDGAGAWWSPDNETGKSMSDQYRDGKIPVERASRDKQGGIQLMQAMLAVSPSQDKANFEVMDTCPETAAQFERYSWKPQTVAMRTKDRWETIDERDDFVTCARYFVQTDPRYQGKREPDPVRVKGAAARIHRSLTKGTRNAPQRKAWG